MSKRIDGWCYCQSKPIPSVSLDDIETALAARGNKKLRKAFYNATFLESDEFAAEVVRLIRGIT